MTSTARASERHLPSLQKGQLGQCVLLETVPRSARERSVGWREGMMEGRSCSGRLQVRGQRTPGPAQDPGNSALSGDSGPRAVSLPWSCLLWVCNWICGVRWSIFCL